MSYAPSDFVQAGARMAQLMNLPIKVDSAKLRDWVYALQSGDYEQTQSSLRCRVEDNQFGYCCLGVLSEISKLGEWVPQIRGALGNLETSSSEFEYQVGDSTSFSLALPEVWKWVLDFSGCDSSVTKDVIEKLNEIFSTFNDNDVSFVEIAEIARVMFTVILNWDIQ